MTFTIRRNPITRTDSYKPTHWPVYPDGTQRVYSYLESRGGKFPETVFFSLYPIIQRYISGQITQEMVDYAAMRFAKHYGTDKLFNREGWEYIVKNHNGYLPLRIRAVPEGTVVPNRNVLMTIENTDDKCFWLTNYVESVLLKVWYGITVATLSREIKKLIASYLEKNGDPSGLPFKLHDFGYRGVSSEESAEFGGAAHLVNFMGSDTFLATEFLNEYYGADMAGYSIPATEHSVMTARGEEGEVLQMKRFLDTFRDLPVPAIACVSDTYNIYRACKEYWGEQLKENVESLEGKVLVIRPDSGEPVQIVTQVVEMLEEKFGATMNDKGYKVLNKVRAIQGDGVNYDAIRDILEALHIRKYSADNIAFGMGGALLQSVNRDTQKFAIKASSYVINGYVKDYQKNPVTDTGKRSKAGRLKLVRDENTGVFTTVAESEIGQDHLITYYDTGEIPYTPNLDDVRAMAELPKSADNFIFD